MVSTVTWVGCSAAETVPLDLGRSPDGGALQGADPELGCTPELEVVTSVQLPDGAGFEVPVVPAGRGQVVRIEPANRRDGTLSRRDLRTGAEVVVGRGFQRILDADENGVLAVLDTEVYVRGESVVRTRRAYDAPYPRQRRLDGTRAWLCPDDTSLVALTGDPPTPTVDLAPRRCPGFLTAQGDSAVFVELDLPAGVWSLFLWRSDTGTARRVAAAPSRLERLALYRSGLIWTSDGAGVEAWSPEAPEPQRLDPGPCLELDALDEAAVVACDPSERRLATRITLITPRGVRTVRKGPWSTAPRLGDGFVAWIEHDPSSLCGRPTTQSEVWLAHLQGGEPIRLAQLDSPCACCGVFWPQPTLEVRGDTVVYTHARPDTEVAQRSVGAAVVRAVCR